MAYRPHVVVLGAGFAGIGALQKLRKAPVRVTLVDRNDYHAFLPLLYQVATNQLDAEHVTSPVEGLLPDGEDFVFLPAKVTGVDLAAKRVHLESVGLLGYDYLLVGLGAVVNYFETPGAAEHAYPLYTLEDAKRLRARISACFRSAEADPRLLEDGVLRFCVTGGGATGVEVAGAIAELLQGEIQRGAAISLPAAAEVHLFEMERELLMPFKPRLRAYARRALERRGVHVHLGEAVASIEAGRVRLGSGTVLRTHTVVWAAGLQAGPLSGVLARKPGARPTAKPDLSLEDHPEVFLAGDMAVIGDGRTGKPLPQLGSVAQQSGQCAAENIARLAAGQPTRPFQYRDKGTMAIIGRGDAIVQLRSGRTLTGKPAWVAWKAVHLMLLAGGEQKARTLLEWGRGLTDRRPAGAASERDLEV